MVVAFILSEEDERTAKAAGWLSRLALLRQVQKHTKWQLTVD
jgi:hypothetical protein